MGPEVPSKSFGIQVGPNEVAGSLLGHFGVNLKPKGPGPSTNKMEVVFVGTFCVAHAHSVSLFVRRHLTALMHVHLSLQTTKAIFQFVDGVEAAAFRSVSWLSSHVKQSPHL